MIEYFSKYKFFALIIIVCVIVIPLVFSLFPSPTGGPGETLPTPTLAPGEFQAPIDISPLQKVKIGKTTESEVAKLPGFLKKEALTDGQVKYSFESPVSSRLNEIITRNGRVVYEKELVPESPSSVGYSKLSEMKQGFGEPEKVIGGSKFYGWPLNQYLYSARGFSFIANPNNDEVYEINFFEPMTVSEYETRYGEDITADSGPRIE